MSRAPTGDFAGALACFGLGSKNDLRGEDGMLECNLGSGLCSGTTRKEVGEGFLTAAAKKFDEQLEEIVATLKEVRAMSPEEAKRRNDLPVHVARLEQKLASRLLLRAAVATVAADAALARKLMRERDLGPEAALVRHEGIPAVLEAIFAAP